MGRASPNRRDCQKWKLLAGVAGVDRQRRRRSGMKNNGKTNVLLRHTYLDHYRIGLFGSVSDCRRNVTSRDLSRADRAGKNNGGL